MLILELILLILAFFTTLLWVMKMVGDSVGAMYGAQIDDDAARKDGIFRLSLIAIMSVLWSLIIIL
jgi:hypothetical protein